MSLQISQQRNLLLQIVEGLAAHGLLTSNGRIRHSAGRSQAMMVGACVKCWPWDRLQHHKLSNRRCAQRRRVDASGKRDGFLQCGTACSAVSPATIRSQACCRQGTVKCPEGANQSRQHGEGLPARPTKSAPDPDPIVLVVVGLAEPPAVADDRVVAAQRAPPRQQMQRDLPRLGLVFGLRQCDKKNHGWREGPPLTVACEVSICWPGLHPPGKVRFKRKKNTAFRYPPRVPHSEHWPVINANPWKSFPNCSWMTLTGSDRRISLICSVADENSPCVQRPVPAANGGAPPRAAFAGNHSDSGLARMLLPLRSGEHLCSMTAPRRNPSAQNGCRY